MYNTQVINASHQRKSSTQVTKTQNRQLKESSTMFYLAQLMIFGAIIIVVLAILVNITSTN